ncbi:hypothetical protein ACT3UQ_16340 [Glutamicibacter sp. AOP12-B1-11]|uniref:hypothetical protein n=1 Tax=Glutamicibacter sp. AOP12-B1-11 TaxID=3457725 RepID=UPI0040338631
MNWLSFPSSGSPPVKIDGRFVATEQACDAPSSAAVGPERLWGAGELACTLVSNDERLVESCALIALGAAVRIHQCAELKDLPAPGNGPVLWGADMAGEALAFPGLCDVVLGFEEDDQQLWSVASQIPRARVAILPRAQQWLGEYLGLWGMRAGQAHCLSLGSLAGGLGTSTLAALVAHAGTLCGLKSLLIDLDPHSTGLWPRVTLDPPTGIGWEELCRSGGALAPHQLVDTLPTVRDTAVLTWSPSAAPSELDEQLVVRLLAAARQGFDLLVVDTGRAVHPQRAVLEQFVDRQVLTCEDTGKPPVEAHIRCGPRNLRNSNTATGQYLGHFPSLPRISRAIQRGVLFDALRSRKVRHALADLRLLPESEGNKR